MVVVCIVIAISDIATAGFSNLFARATAGRSFSDNSSLALLLDHVRRAVCTISAIYLTTIAVAYKKHRLAMLIVLLCLLVNSFPTALARYAMASVYGALLIAMVPRFKRNRIFIFCFIFGFVVVLPFLNVFRRTAFEDVSIFKALGNAIMNIPEAWLAGDYDAFTTLCLSIDYVARYGITWMRQLLGAMLFFVPRTFWPSKPVGTGAMTAASMGMSFTNISMPLPGEAYINLGIVGIILLGFVFGFITRKLDSWYWGRDMATPARIDLIYPLCMFMFFFMCRGDMLSSWAYTAANIAVWFTISQCIAFFSRVRIKI